MSDEYTFVDRPPARGKYDWEYIYELIRSRPGAWLRLVEGGKISTYNAVTGGRVTTFTPEMGVEMMTRNNQYKVRPRTCDIYVRYNPEKDQSLTVKQREQILREMRKREKEERKMKASTVESRT